MQKFLKTVV